MQFINGHIRRFIVNIKKGAFFPVFRLDEPFLLLQPFVQGCSRKGSHQCDLHLIQTAFPDIFKDLFKDLRRMFVQTDDKTAIDSNAMGLNCIDSTPVMLKFFKFPVIVKLNSLERFPDRTLKTDQHLRASRLPHQ